ncbi:uncharacterized protein DUF2778 [Hoeflea marina]|uniref:Uncharacterized protein DUF2778 n=1 Tax=Hoeflea marina TaxID=274592 RepID=A0A317PS91_9HYPH|nr:DUF2778 domain-containing protein [Hoeflea marina]PWW03474.1 uncharacterized protein DUF2778 [Hoeflea marina]
MTDRVYGLRQRSKKRPYGAKAAAVLGVAALIAVTSLLAHQLSRFAGGFTATPAAHGAAVAPMADATRFKALRVHHRVEAAEIALVEPKPAAAVPVNPPAAGTSPMAARVARGPRAAAHAADIDPQRFSSPPAAAPAELPGRRDGWIASSPFEVAELHSAAAAGAASHWQQRIGATALAASAEQFVAPMMIALALAESVAETGTAAALETRDAAAAAVAEAGAAAVELAMMVPVPEPRPQVAAPVAAASVQVAAEVVEAAVVPARRPARPAATPQKPESVLAYASPDVAADEEKSGGIFGRLLGGGSSKRLPGRAAKVAVYDISSAIVHMPNGEKLEAHSGLAHMQDDPDYVKQKNRGPTPPNLYNLRMRESRFHGVEAIRLLPADGRKKFNRDGLLAHTYMYAGGGSRSQSNGCVVFKDYQRFLAAFKKGEIERLIVVESMSKLPTYLAAL